MKTQQGITILSASQYETLLLDERPHVAMIITTDHRQVVLSRHLIVLAGKVDCFVVAVDETDCHQVGVLRVPRLIARSRKGSVYDMTGLSQETMLTNIEAIDKGRLWEK